MIKLTKQWDSQPQDAAGVAWDSPLAERLAFAWTASNTGPCDATGTVAAPQVGLSRTPSSEGIAATFSSSGTTYISLPPALFSTSGEISLLFRVRTTTDTVQALIHVGDNTANNRWAIYIGNGVSGGVTDELISFIRIASGNITNAGAYATSSRSQLMDGAWHTIMVCGNSSSLRIFLDGVQRTVSPFYSWPINALASVAGAAVAQIGVSSTPAIGAKFNGDMSLAAFWTKDMTAHARELHNTPWRLFEPQRIWVPVSIASSGNYTVTADSGTYSVTGQTATLLRNKVVSANYGTYSFTGQSATITYTPTGTNYTLVAEKGDYTYTGQGATIQRSKYLTANSGTYTLTGQNATVSYSGSNTITLKAGSWLRYRIIQ